MPKIQTNTQKKFTVENTKLFSYTGSKAKYKAQFNDLHSKVAIRKVHTYIEAFGGSLASLFHNLENISAERIVINDINPRLINLYKQIKENPHDVIEVFTLLEDTFQNHIPKRFKNIRQQDKVEREKYLAHLRDFYKSAQDYYNSSDFNSSQNAGVLLFLLQHNFNGVYNEAKKTGNFNSSFNWSMKKVNVDSVISNLLNLHTFFTENDVVIKNLDTKDLIEEFADTYDTLIYLDPPYVNSEIGYSSNQTTDFNTVEAHMELLESCRVFDYVMYSNNYVEDINQQLNYTVNFHRTNDIAHKNRTKPKHEVLGLIDNTYISMKSVEVLLNEHELKKLINIPKVENLLASNNLIPKIAPLDFKVNLYTCDSVREVA